MADLNDDKKVETPAAAPSASSAEPAASPSDNPTPSAGSLNTDTDETRFDKVIQSPKFQEYMDRQVQSRMKELMASSSTPPPQKDELAEITSDLDEKIRQGTVTATDLVKANQRIAEIVANSKFAPVQDTVKKVDMQEKIAQFGSAYPDMYEIKDEMTKILNAMPPAQQQYIRNAPIELGMKHLYLEAKERKRLSTSNVAPVNKDLGGSAIGRGGSKAPGGTLIQQAVAARGKGDKAGYEKLMEQFYEAQK